MTPRLFKLFGLSLALLPHFTTGSSAADDPIVATAAELSLHKSDLDRLFLAGVASGLPRVATREELRSLWLDQQAGALEAKSLKLHEKPEILRRIHAVLYDALIEEKLVEDIKKLDVSASEIESYYRSHPEVKIAHIFIAAPRGVDAPTEKAALDRLLQAKKEYLEKMKMSFAEVAARVSQSSSAAQGGELDFRSEEDLDPALYAAARDLKPGESLAPSGAN